MFPAIIDANINRVAEGLRVIEDYCRFVSKDKQRTDELAKIRKVLCKLIPADKSLLKIRSTQDDMRAKEVPTKRTDAKEILIASFKRVQQALRVLEEYTGQSTFNEYRYDLYEIEKDVLLQVEKKRIPEGVYLIASEPDILIKGIKAGVEIIQYRDKSANKEQRFNKAKEIKKRSENVCYMVNDDLDITRLVDADGCHTGQDDLPIQELRKVLGEDKVLGRTTHSLEQGIKAEKEGADYISVGPIWETPSKPGREGIGFDYLKEVKRKIKLPFVAIGGIDQTNIDQVLPYAPPMIGVIRAHDQLKKLNEKIKGKK